MVRAHLEAGGGVLGGVSSRLLTAAETLDGTGASAPTGIDAGPWTALITAMVTKLSEAAGSTAEGLGGCSQAVLDAEMTFGNADEAVRESLIPQGGVGAR